MKNNILERNRKATKNRGPEWKKKLITGKLDAKLHPSKIQLRRSELGISQKTMSETIGLSLSSYGAIERAKRSIKKEKANILAKKLKSFTKNLFQDYKGNKLIAII